MNKTEKGNLNIIIKIRTTIDVDINCQAVYTVRNTILSEVYRLNINSLYFK